MKNLIMTSVLVASAFMASVAIAENTNDKTDKKNKKLTITNSQLFEPNSAKEKPDCNFFDMENNRAVCVPFYVSKIRAWEATAGDD